MPIEYIMPLKNSQTKFGIITQIFHWSIFVLFCFQLFFANRMEAHPHESQAFQTYITAHQTTGVLILITLLGLFISRFYGTRPSYIGHKNRAEKGLALITHVGLYLVFLIMPLSGLLMTWFAGYELAFFEFLIQSPYSKNPQWADFFHSVHHSLPIAVVILVGIHIVAALYHHFVRRDEILKRMLP